MLSDVELVEDDLLVGVDHMLAYRLHIRVPHVHGDSLDTFSLSLSERAPETVETLLLAVLGDIQHPPPRQVVDHGHVLVPLTEGLLIHPQMADGVGLPALQPAFHGSLPESRE